MQDKFKEIYEVKLHRLNIWKTIMEIKSQNWM